MDQSTQPPEEQISLFDDVCVYIFSHDQSKEPPVEQFIII